MQPHRVNTVLHWLNENVRLMDIYDTTDWLEIPESVRTHQSLNQGFISITQTQTRRKRTMDAILLDKPNFATAMSSVFPGWDSEHMLFYPSFVKRDEYRYQINDTGVMHILQHIDRQVSFLVAVNRAEKRRTHHNQQHHRRQSYNRSMSDGLSEEDEYTDELTEEDDASGESTGYGEKDERDPRNSLDTLVNHRNYDPRILRNIIDYM